jgi:hypothetical protein
MKLYTEEQVRQMLEVYHDTDLYEHILTFDDILKTQTPMELPSDEGIKKIMTNNKPREINSPLIKQLIDETSPDELGQIDAEMRNYAEGYKEGYNRAIELTKWAISNLIPPHSAVDFWKGVKPEIENYEQQ